jgi:hypothetical protein
VIQRIHFRECVHRDVVGPTEAAVVAAVLGDYCMPAAAPIEATALFYGVAQVLGGTRFKAIWSAFQKSAPKMNPLDFAAFLAAQEEGRAIPALADLARFDLAFGLAAQPGPAPSIGACCLPDATLIGHPEMRLRFQPGWRYLQLDWPVHELMPEAATPEALLALRGPGPVRLCVSSGGMGVAVRELAPADFALQSALRNGERLSRAIEAARAIDPALDAIAIVSGLVEAGAIMDVVLHPADMPSLAKSDI